MWRCVGLLEDLEDLDARQRGLQAAVLQFVGVGHGGSRGARRREAQPLESPHHIELAAVAGAGVAPCRHASISRALRAALPRCRRSAALGRLPVAAVAPTACSASITPYRVEVVQGNVVTKEQVALVKPGMTPRAGARRARLAAADRRRSTPTAGTTSSRSAARAPSRSGAASSCCFEGDALKSIDTGGDLPAEREFVASIDTFKTSRQRAAAGAHRRAAQGAAGAGRQPAAEPSRRRPRARRASLPAARAAAP